MAGPAILLLCAALATAPQFWRGVSCGHDFDFHLVSWLDALQGWRAGILYPHWTPSPNYGAGEPRFMFYPPLTWMLGAVLGVLLPWRFVPQAMTFILLAGTGFGTRALARQKLNTGIATLAGCAAIFSGYALFTAYERSAYAELTGGFWAPILLLLILHNRGGREPASTHNLLRRTLDGSTLPLTLVVAGAWLSNAPLGVMLTYLLAGVAPTVAVLAKSWAPVMRGAIAITLGLALSAFFLVPAAWERRWVAIRQAIDDPGLRIENSWLFARHSDPALELHDIELIRISMIAVSMVALALVCLAVSRRRRTLSAEPAWWALLGLIPVVVLLLQLPISDPVWRALPELRFLQFPWRWLVVLEAPMAIFFAAAVWAESRWRRAVVYVVCGAAFLSAAGIATVSLFQGCDSEDAVGGMLDDYNAGTGFEGTDEYAPVGADNSLVATDLPFACLVLNPAIVLGKGDPASTPDWSADQGTCDATYPRMDEGRRASPEHMRLVAATPHSGSLVLRLRRYPAWRVRVNGIDVNPIPGRQDGLMAVPVPKGHVDLAVDWTTTPDVLIGRLISGLALVLVTGLWSLEYRRFRPRLS
jgi:6-pyruvoyl-tetrahydropterin synthase related domain